VVGHTISHYKILSRLGKGGMGEVWKAEDTQLRRTVALKFLSAEAVEEEQTHARLIREAQASASLDHPNICAVHGIHEENGETFIAMAYIDGPSLADKIKERPLPLDEALDIAIQIAEGLQEAHEKGIVHRDVKPHNVMLTAKGQVKIMDFGLASLAGRSKLTKSGTTLGTPAYMAPEQLEGQAVDRRADIWALGCVLYEMLTQRTPFDAEYEQAIAYGILNEEPEPVSAQRGDIGPDLDSLVSKALAKDPADRYQHVADLRVDLRGLRRIAGTALRKPVVDSGRTESQAELASRNAVHLWQAVSLALAAVIATALVWTYVSNSQGLSPQWDSMELRRITFDDGLATTPAVSPDGNFVAYASDRAGNGDLDLWLQQVGSGEPKRLTFDSANELEPAFSPDGRRIVFRSDKDGGGIYLMPTLGGDARRLAPFGNRPRFSPDGRLIAYFVGSLFKHFGGTIYTVSPAGGEPKKEFRGSWPVWSPRGDRLLVVTRGPEKPDPVWAVGDPASGDIRVLANSSDLNAEVTGRGVSGFNNFAVPDAWLDTGEVLFSGIHDQSSVWRINVGPEAEVLNEAPRPVTRGGYEREAYASATGVTVFASGSYNEDVWSLPIDSNAGRVLGAPVRLTTSAAIDDNPVVTHDGSLLLFRSLRSSQDFWGKDLATGLLWRMGAQGTVGRIVTNPERTQVIYSTVKQGFRYGSEGDKWYAASLDGSEPREICTACGAPYDWSADGKVIARFGPEFKPGDGDTITLPDGRKVTLITGPAANPRLSRDGKWVAGLRLLPNQLRQIIIYPVNGLHPETEPIRITDGTSNDFTPDWSPDGRLLYFASERDGFRCVYAQPLAPDTKRPQGNLIEVFHSHDARISFGAVANPGAVGVHVAIDMMVITMGESRGDIWMLEPRATE